ncbi:MAG TPA: DUF481 domain-containing protein [Polyangia bacterium]|nr:DUF481 domain-containing protein [Polyangia bacterium]
MKRLWLVVSVLAVCLFQPGAARAQSSPTFTYGKPDETKVDPTKPPPPAVEWKAQVKGGLMLTSGNSQTTNGTFAVSASRRQGNNKLAIDAGAAYGRSDIINPVYSTDPNNATEIDSLERTSITTTNSWQARGRYDRFFTANNSGYASAQAAADKIAGKSFLGGGQIGYSRQLYKSAMHTFVAEIGYDFGYEQYVQSPAPSPTLDPVSIHSARLFLGETWKVTSETGVTASAETYLNLNKEAKALNVSTQMPGVDAFHDTRVIGKLGLTTTVMKRLSVAFGFTLRYDQNPAPLPIPSGAMPGAFFKSGFVPFAEKVDTLTEVSLIYTFL